MRDVGVIYVRVTGLVARSDPVGLHCCEDRILE